MSIPLLLLVPVFVGAAAASAVVLLQLTHTTTAAALASAATYRPSEYHVSREQDIAAVETSKIARASPAHAAARKQQQHCQLKRSTVDNSNAVS